MAIINVIGGGLAGSEAAYQLLKRGHIVNLYEMRKGDKNTPCHHTDKLAELVCSNSLKSNLLDTASGALKEELRLLDSLLIRVAETVSVPSGGALAVNRSDFSDAVERELNKFDNFRLISKEATEIDKLSPVIVASGPLTSDNLANEIAKITGDGLAFYDAAAPIIDGSSIDYDKAFYATRYDKGNDTDYLNCGMDKEQYTAFYDALVGAQVANLHEFDKRDFYEGCMPVEVMARRGIDTIRYGMMKPKGIVNPNNGARYYAVVQLRRENTEGSAYNIVGFQTNLTFPEQKRVFRMIPGLEKAEFLRYGVMHRNTFIDSPKFLKSTFRLKGDKQIYFAGQITGVEGYVESMMSGLIAAINLDREIKGDIDFLPPVTTITGALMRYIGTENKSFQPMNANFGILPEITTRDKKQRKRDYAERAISDMRQYITCIEKSSK